tara:strand:+ start:283 stop:471 length:189 start_codon:yes stop_codon:yes gene_type:complete
MLLYSLLSVEAVVEVMDVMVVGDTEVVDLIVQVMVQVLTVHTLLVVDALLEEVEAVLLLWSS